MNNNIEPTKKPLTDEIIKKALVLKRRPLKAYSDGIVLVVVGSILVALGAVLGAVFAVIGVFRILKVLITNIFMSIGKFYILERPCVDGSLYMSEDEKTKDYRLFFAKKNNKKLVYVSVTQAVFYDYAIGEECYVVFVKGLKNPCLCYKKQEWTR